MDWLQRWRGPAVDESRWLVLDVETSGLDPARDRLIAIAAVAVHVDWRTRRLAIAPGDSFEAVLRQERPSARENILLHGIGVSQQGSGVPPGDALAAFVRHAGASPLLAFHAAFDRQLLQRHCATGLGAVPANHWLDIEPLCGVAYPQVRARSLDDWLDHFGIECAARHQAAADTLAECELLLRVWPRLAPECACWRDLRRLAGRRRWLAQA